MSIIIPGHSIAPTTPADLPFIADLLRASKLQLTINRFLFKSWPDEPNQIALYTSAVERGFHDLDGERFKVVEDETGKIVAHMVLTHKKKEKKSPEVTEEQAMPKGLDPAIVGWVNKAVAEVGKVVEGVEHLALTHICVTPSSQKQGIGSSLLEIGIERAKDMKIPFFVCSEPQARDFFFKLDFKETSHMDIDLSEYAPKYCGYGVFRVTGMLYEG